MFHLCYVILPISTYIIYSCWSILSLKTERVKKGCNPILRILHELHIEMLGNYSCYYNVKKTDEILREREEIGPWHLLL